VARWRGRTFDPIDLDVKVGSDGSFRHLCDLIWDVVRINNDNNIHQNFGPELKTSWLVHHNGGQAESGDCCEPRHRHRPRCWNV
jgi:hypothetical protein